MTPTLITLGTLATSVVLMLATSLKAPAQQTQPVIAASASANTFSNPSAIAIKDATYTGLTLSVPSSITVAGMSEAVNKVSVTLHNLKHDSPRDLDILLVGPSGQSVVLMAGAGWFDDLSGTTLTFEDGAEPMPQYSSFAPGTYRPSRYGSIPADVFPVAGPYAGSLSVFNSHNPNGEWKLYVLDTELFDMGFVAGGWSLSFNTDTTAANLH